MSALTSAERAALIISSSQISLDPKLSIFTVNGTTEPRVVRLFLTTTCSCPAKADCYHVLAAQMAVGITKEVRKRTLKLTQLRKNTCKRPDKTSGRKRPRLADVDVVPADDHDSDQLSQMHAAISTGQEPSSSPPPQTASSSAAPPEPSAATSVSPDGCNACGAYQPPFGKCRRRKLIDWVQCDKCDNWYHMCCIHLTAVPEEYVCGQCDWL